MSMPRTSIVLPLAGFILVLLASCARAPDAAGPHRWSRTTITYSINTEATVLTETTIRQVFEAWAGKTGLTFVYGGRGRAGLHRDGRSTVSFLTRWPAEIPISKLAYTRCWYDRKGDITEADIIFNNQVARFTTLKTNKPDSYYLEGVLSHEIGHLLGLAHSDSASSLMKPDSPMEESWFKGAIDNETLAAFRALYTR
jgi:hypothetical protein